jgi:hypothetical protein
MAKKFIRKMVIVAKNETVVGTDAAPIASNSLLARAVTITPMEGDEVQDDFLQPYFGASPTTQVTAYSKLAFSVPFAGVTAAGTLPAYAPLLRACGMALTEEVDVAYTVDPVTDGAETVSIYALLDGLRQKFLGSRGTVKVGIDAKGRPEWQFDFTGVWAPATDSPLLTPDYTGWLRALPVTKANTTLSLDGIDLQASSFAWDAGNQVVKTDLIGVDDVDFNGRQSTGSVTFRTQAVATKDWLTAARNRAQVPVLLRHGQAATNVIKLTGNAELGKLSYSEMDGVHMTTIPLRFIPTGAGNNEWQFEIH